MEAQRFTELSAHYLDQYLSRIRACVAMLSEDEVWWRARPEANTIGNLLLHLHGNLSLWVLNALGGQPFERHRSAEFAADRSASKTEMLERLAATVASCRAVIAGMDDQALAAPRKIQGYDTDGLGALYHVVEHMSYHTGQIVFVTKQIAGGREAIEFWPQHRGE
jgi:uncharacterized damage-inducible protein DinB